jgi:hypothetical protein
MVGHPPSGKPSPQTDVLNGVGGTPDPLVGVRPTPDSENSVG